MKRVTIDQQRLIELTQPLVYVVYVKGKAQYVGATTKGIVRPFSNNHHVISKIDKQDISSLELILCGSAEEAFNLESILISKLDPDLNGQNPRIKREKRKALVLPTPKKEEWLEAFDAQKMLDEFIQNIVSLDR